MIQLNSKLFQDPGLTYPLDNLDLPFSEYVSACKTVIENTRLDLNSSQNPQVIINANLPFELSPPATGKKFKYGALLIHGLYDSPSVMRDLGESLRAQGLLVRAILLPGHGTVPGALLNVGYQEWLQAVHYGVTNLSADADKIFLVGFSTGASLSLYHLLNGSYQNIAGAVMLAPAIKISPLASLTKLFMKTGKLWLHQDEEIDYAKYRSFTYNSANQIYQLTQEIEKLSRTHPLKTPLLVAISQNDKTVSSNATLKYFKNHTPVASQLILYRSSALNTSDTRVIVRPSVYKEMNIVDISHVALPIAPDNPHYGMYGDYELASHVEKNLQEGGEIFYGTYNTLRNNILNQLHKVGLYQHERVRLTFNPDFDFLRATLAKFVKVRMEEA
jgi:esterase/lipase